MQTVPSTNISSVGQSLCIPLGFATVSDGVYRSAYPRLKTWPFIKSLKLKSMICLSQPSDIRDDLIEFCQIESIQLFQHDIGYNQEPFLVMSPAVVTNVLKLVGDKCNHPILLFCTTGKVRVSCTVGCLRKLQGWSLVSIFHEFEQFCDAEGGVVDLLFIENFKSTESNGNDKNILPKFKPENQVIKDDEESETFEAACNTVD